MKKRIIGLFAFVLSFSFLSVPVFASSNSYTLDELGLVVTIPSKYDVVTQDTSPNSSIFSDRGLSGSDIIDQFKANLTKAYEEKVGKTPEFYVVSIGEGPGRLA